MWRECNAYVDARQVFGAEETIEAPPAMNSLPHLVGIRLA